MKSNSQLYAKSKFTIEILPFHPAADIFPLMEGKELDELAGNIKRRGLRISIVKHNDKIIDGRNRALACQIAGVTPTYTEFAGADEDVPRFITSMNIYRRHLKPEQREEFLSKLIGLNPEKSNLQLSKEAKTSEKTVKKVRAEMEARSDTSERQTRIDTKGRKQPARKAHKVNGNKPTGNPPSEPKPPIIELGKGEYSELSTSVSPATTVPSPTTETLTISAPPPPTNGFDPAVAPFMAHVNQLLSLNIHGLRLTAADAAKVADLRTKLRQILIENSGAGAPGTVTHPAAA